MIISERKNFFNYFWWYVYIFGNYRNLIGMVREIWKKVWNFI